MRTSILTARRGAGMATAAAPRHLVPILRTAPATAMTQRTPPVHLSTAPVRPTVATRFLPSDQEQHSMTTVIPWGAAAPAGTALFNFVCPACHEHHFQLLRNPDRFMPLSCQRCGQQYGAHPEYLDLVMVPRQHGDAHRQHAAPQARRFLFTEIFRSPVVSWLYERGWRQAFALAGFPGVDAEFKLAMDYLRPAYGQVVVDMSCGSGLFTRRFARSGKFQGVVAADFSENMLRQTRTFLQEDRGAPKGQPGPATSCPVVLLRADVGRLPFATGSVAAIHAGAAIHCWPNPMAALAEISRVLAPGGVFVASAFMRLDDVDTLPVVPVQLSKAHVFWTKRELLRICSGVGLRDLQHFRRRRFMLFKVTKPTQPASGDGSGCS